MRSGLVVAVDNVSERSPSSFAERFWLVVSCKEDLKDGTSGQERGENETYLTRGIELASSFWTSLAVLVFRSVRVVRDVFLARALVRRQVVLRIAV